MRSGCTPSVRLAWNRATAVVLAGISVAIFAACEPPPTPPGLGPENGGRTVVPLGTIQAPDGDSSGTPGSAETSEASRPILTRTPTLPPTPTEAPPPATVDLGDIHIGLTTVLEGLQKPIFMVDRIRNAPGRSFLVAEKRGVVRQAEDGVLMDRPFLDIEDAVRSEGTEQGLLGLALHPDFAVNGRLFVNYTNREGDTRVSEFVVAAGSDGTVVGPERELLAVDQPAANHNGGMLAFGPDGYLYVGLGDGGGQGDSHGNGQKTDTLLAKVLRIDVDAPPAEGKAYAIPPGNPFEGDPRFAPETWVWGLRNPWRFSFDRLLGDLYIGDVGQGTWEEVDIDWRRSRGGENYGWPIMEGSHCYASQGGCDKEGRTERPILEYSHDEGGCSVAGGYVYRGEAVAGLQGVYLYGDYCSGKIWGGRQGLDGAWASHLLLDTELAISSFAEDESGELYVLDLDGGTVSKIVGE